MECDRSKNGKKAFWTAYCDSNGNGQYDETEVSQRVITNRCNPVNNLNSLWEINCGTGVQTRQCGVDLTEAAAIRNGNAEPLPVLAECAKVLSTKKTRWKFTCDRNQNGVADEDEVSQLIVVNQKRFHNVDFNCGTYDDCFGCTDEELTGFVTNKETENPGSIIYECVETLWGTGKARYRYACDNNLNGVIDDGDKVSEYIVKQDEN